MATALRLTGLVLRTYVRDRTAVFFSFVLPLLFMVIFGSLNLGGTSRPSVGIADLARNPDSVRLVETLRGIDSLRVRTVERDEGLQRLRRSELDVMLVLPADFRIAPARPGVAVPVVELHENSAARQSAAIAGAILRDVVARISFEAAGAAPIVTLARQEVAGARLGYVEFLLPGILGMNVMNLNLMSIAFALVTLKRSGALRRILATPVDPRSFIAAHGLTRLIVSTVQVGILVGVAYLLFNVRVVGSLADLLLLSVIGALPFLMIGLALAAWGRSTSQVEPLAQLLTLPQLFLSGVFFSREAVPQAIRPITDLLPLTFLNEGLREIAIHGASLWDVRTQALGLLVWTALGFALALAILRTRRAAEWS